MAEVQARTVLWYLVFIGFAVNYMIRINLNITIVEMIISKADKSLQSLPSEIAPEVIESSDRSGDVLEQSIPYINKSGARNTIENHLLGDKSFNWTNVVFEPKRFDWNEYQQGLVLGSFFWCHWITQIPGGILAKKYGTKLVFGLSNAIGCWMCFFIPMCSHWDYRCLICLRVLQGLITGLAWPAMHVLTAKWIPPNERSKFVTAYLGSSVGIALFYPLFGYVMHWSSWEWVYHICGIIGTLWWFGWLIFVYDTPAQHPRISSAELRYIEKELGSSVQNANNGPTPWGAILTSRPVWMNVIAQWGGIWGLFTLMTQAPTYFTGVHMLNIRATGILSGLPHLMRMLFALVFSVFADNMLRRDKMSRTNLRKLATAICCILNGFVVLALAYFGHNATAAIIFLTVATMFHGSVASGPLASIVDISPNHAGVVLGISGMIGVLPGFISPYIVGILTLGNQTFEAWTNVFNITAAMLIGSGVLYLLFSDSTLQSWNTNSIDAADKEMQLLNTNLTNNLEQKDDEKKNKNDIS